MILEADDYSYVPLFRKLKASPIIQSGPLCQVFLFILLDATYFDKRVSVPVNYGRKTVMLTKGETFINTKELAGHLKISDQTVRRCLHALKERETITLEVVHGGFKVRLVNAEPYWDKRDTADLEHSVLPSVSPMCTHPESSNAMTSGNGDGERVADVGTGMAPISNSAKPQDLETQGLGSPLRTIELSSNTHVSTENTLSTKKNKDSLVVGVGAKASQLDLIAPDPVPMDSQDKEIEVSAFFAAKDEPEWKALQKNGKWIHAMVTAHPDTAFVLRELAHYYQWWIENPKKRRSNMAASIGNWLRTAEKDLIRPKGNNGRVKSLPVPTEPGKYDGIGVTYSAFEE